MQAKGSANPDLDLIHKSPAHYKAKCAGADSRAFFIGEAAHSAILEPEKFAAAYQVLPEDFNGRTKEGKAILADIELQGKKALKAEDAAMISGMAAAVMAQPIAKELLSGAQCELSGFADMAGVLCKCRPDVWNERRKVIADLKTTADASVRSFNRSIANYRYYVQAAFYSDLWPLASSQEVSAFIFIVVEKAPPYAVSLFSISPEYISRGRDEYNQDLNVYKHCAETGKWPGYPQEITTVSAPQWL